MNKHNLNEVKEHCNKIFNENIKGGIFNLFYMSEDEMQAELGINSTDIDIIKNLTEVKQLIEKEKIITIHNITIHPLIIFFTTLSPKYNNNIKSE